MFLLSSKNLPFLSMNKFLSWQGFVSICIYFSINVGNQKRTCPWDKSCQRFTCQNQISTCPGQLDKGFWYTLKSAVKKEIGKLFLITSKALRVLLENLLRACYFQ